LKKPAWCLLILLFASLSQAPPREAHFVAQAAGVNRASTSQEVHITGEKENYLRDEVGLLNREQRTVIIALLEKQSSKPLGRIYLDFLDRVPATMNIEEYARKRLNESPRLPKEKIDKIMLVVALKDHALRIETSRDVRTILTDEYCHQVNREVAIPKFRSGAYFEGIRDAIEALSNKLAAN
jgi:uncharacterized membrane protein YgcG